MKFGGVRFVLIGLVMIPLGVAWFALSAMDSEMVNEISGGIWKGPLLSVAGTGALLLGIIPVIVRMILQNTLLAHAARFESSRVVVRFST